MIYEQVVVFWKFFTLFIYLLWFSWIVWKFGLTHFVNPGKFNSNTKKMKISWPQPQRSLVLTQITWSFQPLAMTFHPRHPMASSTCKPVPGATQWNLLQATQSQELYPLPSELYPFVQIWKESCLATYYIISAKEQVNCQFVQFYFIFFNFNAT